MIFLVGLAASLDDLKVVCVVRPFKSFATPFIHSFIGRSVVVFVIVSSTTTAAAATKK